MAKINSRQKGANGEREFAAVLQKVVNEVALLCGYVPPTIRRNTEQSQIGGEDLTGLPWYSFEIKRCERVELDKWWQQTCTQAARKASGSTAWDALAKGGWKRLAGAGGGSGQVGGGTSTQAGEAARQGSREGQQAGGPIEVGSSVQVDAAGTVRQVAVGGLPIPAWSCGGLVPGGVPLFGGGGGPSLAGNPVSSPVEGGSPLEVGKVAGGDRSPVIGARVPVLAWRVNKGEWYIRARLNVLDANAKTRSLICDLVCEDWLELFRTDLALRLRG